MIVTYLTLFFEFFKTGLFAVGGGMATLPFLYEIAAKYPWFTTAQLADMIAVSESTPGPIGINMATYAGYHTGGVLGGVIATFALVLPSLIVIMVVANFLKRFNDSKAVQYAFYGLRPAVTGLIAAAALEVFKLTILSWDAFVRTKNILDFFHWESLAIFAVLFIAMKKIKIHPVFFIAAGALLGVLLKL
ncbi:chromate transporter [Anaerolentibacter hominis]|uniref:chromate transporter n=1 Tax=Anaerolentibacter hominis TaxID=3079009 RepID=UPI0031B85E0E